MPCSSNRRLGEQPESIKTRPEGVSKHSVTYFAAIRFVRGRLTLNGSPSVNMHTEDRVHRINGGHSRVDPLDATCLSVMVYERLKLKARILFIILQ
ncbi:hypothetical protein C8Q80DRAFT_731629 [Daedaleopsis nitida]|nr:hypothetical protein C8Q80DRAFT_731629 [Daedaleopsis nitida]